MRPNEDRISPNIPMTAPYQSKLIPHEDFIRQCRSKRWSYPRIATALLETHGVKTGASTIFEFVKVRAKKRQVFALPPKESGETFFERAPAQPAKNDESIPPKFIVRQMK